MRTKLQTLAAALALIAAGRAVAEPSDNAGPRAAAIAFEKAQQAGDRAALTRLLAPDFLFVRADGGIGNRQDYIDGFTAPGHSLQPLRIVDPLFVRAGADTAIVGGEAWLEGMSGGQPLREHFRYSDVLALRGGVWVVIYRQVTGLPAG